MPTHCQMKIPEKFLGEVRCTFPYSLVRAVINPQNRCVATRNVHKFCVVLANIQREEITHEVSLSHSYTTADIPPREAARNQDETEMRETIGFMAGCCERRAVIIR